MGYVHQFNVTYEEEFRRGWLYSVAYLGHEGVGLGWWEFWNMPDQRDEMDSFDAENLASRRPIQEYRYQTRIYRTNEGDSSYHAAQFQLKARLSRLRLLTWYTLARARSNMTGTIDDYYVRSHPGTPDQRDWGLPASAGFTIS